MGLQDENMKHLSSSRPQFMRSNRQKLNYEASSYIKMNYWKGIWQYISKALNYFYSLVQ